MKHNQEIQSKIQQITNKAYPHGLNLGRTSLYRNLAIASSIGLVVLLGLLLFPISLKESTAEGITPVESETTISITTGYESANLDLIINSGDGTFSTSEEESKAKFGITTNNYTGYILTISAKDDDGLLTNSASGDTLASISSMMSKTSFDVSSNNGKWGFLPSKYYDALADTVVNNTAEPLYLPSPTTTATILDKTTSANASPNDYTIGLGARADYGKPSGVYTNTFILTATANPVAYAITYTDGTGDSTVSNLPSQQISDDTVTGTSVALAPDSIPTRTDFKFKSWCLGTINTTGAAPAGTICTGTEYHAGDSLNLDQTSGNVVTLYAVWTAPIQDISASACSVLAASSNYATYDKRDDKEYTIRYINNNCWMTSNLRFTSTSTDTAGTMTLDSTTSNVKDTYTPASPLTISYGEFFTDQNYNEAALHTGVDNNNNPTVWYNFAAASAGTITGASNQNSQIYDICPSGWRLPTYDEQNSLVGYQTQYDIVTGGRYGYQGNFGYPGIGFWWSSTKYDASSRYIFIYDSSTSSLSVGSRDSRTTNFYIRCIRGDTKIDQMKYMQDFAQLDTTKKSQVLNSMTTNQAYTMTDIRDSKTYTIKKLATGDVWMTDNLLFQGNSVTPETTNVTTTHSWTYYDLSTQAANDTSPCYTRYTDWTTDASGPGFANACMYYVASDSNVGNKPNAWYNYSAATARTITGPLNTTLATEDICPSGWSLPSDSQLNNIASYTSQWNPVGGGYMVGNSTDWTNHGYWWTTVKTDDIARRFGFWPATGDVSVADYYGSRGTGFSIRCIVK